MHKHALIINLIGGLMWDKQLDCCLIYIVQFLRETLECNFAIKILWQVNKPNYLFIFSLGLYASLLIYIIFNYNKFRFFALCIISLRALVDKNT